jgi:hypothetical protein
MTISRAVVDPVAPIRSVCLLQFPFLERELIQSLLVQKYIARQTSIFYPASECVFEVLCHADHSGRAI